MNKKLRAIAIYLPQYHPIPENDENWGKGFTEWSNVVKGKSIFKGQYQPHIPADLGFYDLRLSEIREQQALLAKEHNIYGFCYYHYWFNGKLVLEKPLQEVIKLKKPDFPFCICWANENWTRAWDGKAKNILLEQIYSKEDNADHIHYLCKNIFNDYRYIKIDEKPVFVIYRPSLITNIKETSELWRKIAREYGFKDLYLIYVETLGSFSNPKVIGFDAAMQFPPYNHEKNVKPAKSIIERLFSKFNIVITKRQRFFPYDYGRIVNYFKSLPQENQFVLYPSVTPMWDNYVRRQKEGAYMWLNSTPEKYFDWLNTVCYNWNPPSKEENLIFINAWNEWAEGNHLEPCQKWGTQYLQKTKEVLEKYK